MVHTNEQKLHRLQILDTKKYIMPGRGDHSLYTFGRDGLIKGVYFQSMLFHHLISGKRF